MVHHGSHPGTSRTTCAKQIEWLTLWLWWAMRMRRRWKRCGSVAAATLSWLGWKQLLPGRGWRQRLQPTAVGTTTTTNTSTTNNTNTTTNTTTTTNINPITTTAAALCVKPFRIWEIQNLATWVPLSPFSVDEIVSDKKYLVSFTFYGTEVYLHDSEMKYNFLIQCTMG